MIGTQGENEVHLPPAWQHPHTYLVGQTGSGKSELLKAIVHSLLDEQAALVVIDPDGRLVEQIVHWPEFVGNPRLCYFNPTLKNGYTPCINPFEATGDTQVLAEQLVQAFAQLVEGDGSDVSRHMETVLMPCLRTLFDRPGSTLQDLQRFMDADPELIAAAKKSRHPNVPTFFESPSGFINPHYKPTKAAIYSRLQQVFNSSVFVDVTCGESTIHLEKIIADKRILLCNLAEGTIGPRGSQTLGRLIIAMFQGIAMRRDGGTPIHLIVDECGPFLSESVRTIMARTRKYGLYLTLAQQTVGADMSPAVREAVTGNANVTITGGVTKSSMQDAAKLLGVNPQWLGFLSRGKFLMSIGNYSPQQFTTRSDLAGFSNRMSKSAWSRLIDRQLKVYYRTKGQVEGQVEPEDVKVDTEDDSIFGTL